MIASFVSTPIFAWLNLSLVRKNTGVGALPRWLLWLAWIGLVYLSAFTLLFLFSQTGLLG